MADRAVREAERAPITSIIGQLFGKLSMNPRSRRWRSLSNAFMTWLAAQQPALKGEIVAKKRCGRVVLRFSRFPSLRGRVWNHCLAIYASPDPDAYMLFDLDCLPILSDDASVFVCGFCESDRKGFDSREALWDDHLFDPFGRWVTRKLMPAHTIEQKRIGRWRFARFLPAELSESEEAVFENGGVDHLRPYRSRRAKRG